MRRKIAAVLAVIFMSGCSQLSKHSSFSELTATDSQKRGMLEERVNKFNREVYWGVLDAAAEYMEPEARDEFRHTAKERRRSEKIVEQTIDDIEFDFDNDIAWVDVRTRYFEKRGTNYVKERLERQQWRFHRIGGGWLYAGAEEEAGGSGPGEAAAVSPGSITQRISNTWSHR